MKSEIKSFLGFGESNETPPKLTPEILRVSWDDERLTKYLEDLEQAKFEMEGSQNYSHNVKRNKETAGSLRHEERKTRGLLREYPNLENDLKIVAAEIKRRMEQATSENPQDDINSLKKFLKKHFFSVDFSHQWAEYPEKDLNKIPEKELIALYQLAQEAQHSKIKPDRRGSESGIEESFVLLGQIGQELDKREKEGKLKARGLELPANMEQREL